MKNKEVTLLFKGGKLHLESRSFARKVVREKAIYDALVGVEFDGKFLPVIPRTTVGGLSAHGNCDGHPFYGCPVGDREGRVALKIFDVEEDVEDIFESLEVLKGTFEEEMFTVVLK